MDFIEYRQKAEAANLEAERLLGEGDSENARFWLDLAANYLGLAAIDGPGNYMLTSRRGPVPRG